MFRFMRSSELPGNQSLLHVISILQTRVCIPLLATEQNLLPYIMNNAIRYNSLVKMDIRKIVLTKVYSRRNSVPFMRTVSRKKSVSNLLQYLDLDLIIVQVLLFPRKEKLLNEQLMQIWMQLNCNQLSINWLSFSFLDKCNIKRGDILMIIFITLSFKENLYLLYIFQLLESVVMSLLTDKEIPGSIPSSLLEAMLCKVLWSVTLSAII